MPVRKAVHAVPNHQLRRARQQRLWSQTYVAEQIGASQAFLVNRWERGTTIPSKYYQQKLCELFGMSPSDLGFLTALEHERPSVAPEFIYDPAIPVPLANFRILIGRDTLLEHVKMLLSSDQGVGGVALNGLPGVGKTALARAVVNSADIQTMFHDGILWSGVGPTPRLQSLFSRWGRLLGLSEAEAATLHDTTTWARALHAAIGRRKMLLVIDDAWRIEDALALKVGGPNCAYLLTTRLPEVATLFAGKQAIRVEELGEETGVALLAELAPLVVQEEPAEARALVSAVGGLPLAITLIGNILLVQARHQQRRRIRAVIARLQSVKERLDLEYPQGGIVHYSGLPEGTPLSLQAVIHMSDEQLDEPSQQMLRAIAIFPAKPNSFSEKAALTVAAAPIELLDRLMDAGLVEGSGQSRYMLHQTIADYARLQEYDTAAEERFIEYFIAYVDAAGRNYIELEVETINVLTALQLAFEKGFSKQVQRGANAFFRFLEVRGLYGLAETHVKRAYNLAAMEQDGGSMMISLHNLGKIAEKQGAYAQAETYFQEGLTLARKRGDLASVSLFLQYIGLILRRRGDYSSAEGALQEGLAIARRLDHQELMSHLLLLLAATLGEQGKFVEEGPYLQEALVLARQMGNTEQMNNILVEMGVFAAEQGDFTSAEIYLQEALAQARQIGHRPRICGMLANLGELASEQRQFVQATVYLEEGLAIAREIGYLEVVCVLLGNLGGIARESGEYAQAEAHYQEGLALGRQMESYRLINSTLMELGELYLKQYRIEEAEAIFRESASIPEKGIQGLRALAQFGLARVAAARGDYVEAQYLGKSSVALFEDIGHRRTMEAKQWVEALSERNQDNIQEGHTNPTS